MGFSLFLAVVAVICLVMAYLRESLVVTTAALAVWLVAWSYYADAGLFNVALVWLLSLAVLIPLNASTLRRELISNRVLELFRKLMPPISKTEREALEAGTVWWEGDLFGGRPRWNRLMSFRTTPLTAEERAFLNGPTERLCGLLDDWDITETRRDLPPEVWAFVKEQKFLGMIIPREYGGLGFSARAHSEVIMKIASRSVTAAVNVMVPNSLGPAELLLHYGTDEQKKHYLPGLADGTEVPCFALTEPLAGSDAGSISSSGTVMKGTFDGKEITGIRLNWDKRYITLAPVATVMGLAFRLYDPNHLIGDRDDVGITVALIPSGLPGIEYGARHDPLSVPFLNGPVRGKDVFIPVDFIVGGEQEAGNGWRMLMERLAIGRGISLPALSLAAVKLACRGTGAYARIRKQFGLPVGRFEGVEEYLAAIAGNAYLMDAARVLTVGAIDAGEKPALVSAIAKYSLTERMRGAVNRAMDVQGGAGIVLGPRNFMGRVYQSVPISVTVEGANILTRTLIVFGQGIIRAHPYVLREMEASAKKEFSEAQEAFDHALFGHIGFVASNAVRAFISGLTFDRLLPSPESGASAPYFRRVGRMSAAFAFCADCAMMLLGGELRRKEKLSGRLADVLANLYLASAALKKFVDDGRQDEDLPLMRWAVEDALYRSQEQLYAFLENLPNRVVAITLTFVVFPFGRSYAPPSDRLGRDVAAVILAPGGARDRLTAGMYVPKETSEQLGKIEDALGKVISAEPVEKKIQQAVKSRLIVPLSPEDRIEEAHLRGVITKEEKEIALTADRARFDVVTVDEFPPEHWERKGGDGS